MPQGVQRFASYGQIIYTSYMAGKNSVIESLVHIKTLIKNIYIAVLSYTIGTLNRMFANVCFHL